MDTQTILSILRSRSPEAVKTLVQSLPESNMKSSALLLAGSGNPGMDVLALAPLITMYCNGENPEVGASLALATHTFAVEIYEAGGNHGLLPMTLSGLAYQYVNALNLLGRSREVVTFTDQYIPYYQRIGENQNLSSLKTARINALINLNQIDEAQAMLQDPTLRGNWATDIEITRLEKELARLTGRVTETARTPSAAAPLDDDMVQTMLGALLRAINISVDDPNQKEALLEAAKKLDLSRRLDPNKPEDFKRLNELLKQGTKFLTGEGKEDFHRLVEQLTQGTKSSDR
jgi:hypothetical protein